jgi:DNA-binding transcriptional ArsR family regulator
MTISAGELAFVLDHLVMLISTGFFPLWSLIGLETTLDKSGLQMSCRDITVQILDKEENYYLVDFSSKRAMETLTTFETSLQKYGADEVALAKIREWLASGDIQRSSKTFAVFNIGRLIVTEAGDPPITPNVKNAIRKALATLPAPPSTVESLEILCLYSDSEWDSYIRGLRPGEPDASCHFLDEIFRMERYNQVWSAISSHLSPLEMEELKMWYREIYKRLMRRKLWLPGDPDS